MRNKGNGSQCEIKDISHPDLRQYEIYVPYSQKQEEIRNGTV